MQNVCWTFIFSLLLFSPRGFAAEVLVYYPDDAQDPVKSERINVRPGEKVTIAAGVFDRDPRDNGLVQQSHSAQEFSWLPSCPASSPACPKVSAGSGSVVTIDISTCMPLGPMVFKVSFGALGAAEITLINTEEPSVCPDAGDQDQGADEEPFRAGINGRSGSGRSSFGGHGGSGGSFGGGKSFGGRNFGARRFDNDGFFGSGYSSGGSNAEYDPYRPPAMVMECVRGAANHLVCRNVDQIRMQRHFREQQQQELAQRLARQKILAKKNAAKAKAKRVAKVKAPRLANL